MPLQNFTEECRIVIKPKANIIAASIRKILIRFTAIKRGLDVSQNGGHSNSKAIYLLFTILRDVKKMEYEEENQICHDI